MFRRSKVVCGCIVAGAVFLALGIAMIPVLTYVTRREITKNVLLINGTQNYKIWQHPKVPIYLEVYVFDLKNAYEVLEGEKPYVKQRGPYVYKEERIKYDIVHNDNCTITYKQNKTYHFVRDMSVGNDSDLFTTINIPFVTLVNAMQYEPWLLEEVVKWLLPFLNKEKLFIKRSVRDIVWGYPDQILEAGHLAYPKVFNTYIVGALSGKNSTNDGVYSVFTGESDIEKLGIIDTYNGSSKLNFWTTDEANMVNGSDGTICPPFVEKADILRMFSTDICRSIYGTYHGDTKSPQGIPLYRFTAPVAAFENSSANPSNQGFCTPKDQCMGTGVLNMSVCQMVDSFHIPVVASLPHFYQGDEMYYNAIDGMDPTLPGLDTEIDVEPYTGFVMQAFKRLQININVENNKTFSEFQNVRDMVYPVLFINETAIIDDKHANLVKSELMQPLEIAHIIQYVLIGLGVSFLIIAVVTTVVLNLRVKESDDNQTETAHQTDYGENDRENGVENPSMNEPLVQNT